MKWEYTETELWRCGENDVSIFHVFGLTSYKKYVFCFAEARYNGGGDTHCPHDIVMRISKDFGKTFEPSVCLIHGLDKYTWTNPVPLFDAENEKLFLFYSENPDNLHTDVFYITSDDFGSTWSSPVNINGILEDCADKKPFHLAGPGHGIQLKYGDNKGRLILPVWHRFGIDRPADKRGYCVSALYSDDHGATWHNTKYIGYECSANESRIVETQNDLLWIIRPGSPDHVRRECRSNDGGITWGQITEQNIEQANNCDAGAISLSYINGCENMVLVSAVSTIERRRNMAVHSSYDGGRTFTKKLELMHGDAFPGYSDMCVLDEDEPKIGLIHCRCDHVMFSRISLQTLTNGNYDKTHRNVYKAK